MTKPKVLILDFDGVLNCHTTKERRRPPYSVFVGIDPAKLEMVHRIIRETGCDVVLASTWRTRPDSMVEATNLLPIADITPIMGYSRGKEIGIWLSWNQQVEKYAILDDDTSILPEHRPNWFQTSFYTDGLTDEITDRVIEHLGRDDGNGKP